MHGDREDICEARKGRNLGEDGHVLEGETERRMPRGRPERREGGEGEGNRDSPEMTRDRQRRDVMCEGVGMRNKGKKERTPIDGDEDCSET